MIAKRPELRVAPEAGTSPHTRFRPASCARRLTAPESPA